MLELAERLLHEVQGVLLPQGRPSTTSPRAGSSPGRPPCGARPPPGPSRVGGPRLPNSLDKDLRDPRPAGQAGQPEEALIPRVHDRGHNGAPWTAR